MVMQMLAQAAASAWWTPSDAGWIGGLSGAGLGLVGSALGVMAGVLIPRGKGRGVMMWTTRALAVFGVVMVIVGLVALAKGQPYHVWYPVLLLGAIATVVFGSTLLWLPGLLRQIEQRRMDAAAFRQSTT